MQDDFPHKVTMVVVVNGFVVAVISGDGLVAFGVVVVAGVTIIFVFTGVIVIVLVIGLCCCFSFLCCRCLVGGVVPRSNVISSLDTPKR